MQSSIDVQQSIGVIDNNCEKCSGINVEQNIDVVNDNSDEYSIVNVVARNQLNLCRPLKILVHGQS